MMGRCSSLPSSPYKEDEYVNAKHKPSLECILIHLTLVTHTEALLNLHQCCQ